MLILIALLLGLVEGLTEFLPISSTGHLIIAGHLLNFTGTTANVFEVVIQLGAILAVVWVYFGKFVGLANWRNQHGFHGRRGLQLLLITILPALIAGALLNDVINQYLFNPITVAISLIIGGIIIIALERHPVAEQPTISLDNISNRQALSIGLIQCVSLVPGVSRAASTILGGMGVGLNRKTAVEYSFLIAVPIMIAATGYDLLKYRHDLHSSDIGLFAAGLISSFVFAMVAIRFMLRYVRSNDFQPFGWYRIVLGTIVLLYFGLR